MRVNAVCPAWIKTEMDVADQRSGAYSDADIVNRVPMARFASPQDVANAIAFSPVNATIPIFSSNARAGVNRIPMTQE